MQCDASPEAVSYKMRSLYAERVHDAGQVFGHVTRGIAACRHVTRTVPSELVYGHPEVSGQEPHDLRVPKGHIRPQTVYHHKVGAVSHLEVIEAYIAYGYLGHPSMPPPAVNYSI